MKEHVLFIAIFTGVVATIVGVVYIVIKYASPFESHCKKLDMVAIHNSSHWVCLPKALNEIGNESK